MTHPTSDGARAAAAAAPKTFIYEVDQWFDPDGEVPGWGVIGAWRSNASGEIDSGFTGNEKYRPSPVVLGYRGPLSDFEHAMQLMAAGCIDHEQFAEAVVRSIVWVVQLDGHAGDLSVADSSAGKAVEALTTPNLVANGVLGHVASQQLPLVRVRELLPADVRIALNPGTVPPLAIPDRR